MRVKHFCLFLIFLLSVSLFSGCSSREHMLTVGFIYTGNVSDQGMNEAQEKARTETVSLYNGAIQTVVKEQVNPENIHSVVNEMIQSGTSLIFVSDNSLQDQIVELAAAYPDVDFVVYNGSAVADNIKNYSARYYEVEYLSGIIAGKATKNNLIGYLAPNLNPNTLVNINAFALGVYHSNPEATIELDVTGDTPSRSRLSGAISKMEFNRCDVIASILSDNSPLIEAAQKGIEVIAFSDTDLTDQENFLTAVSLDLVEFYSSVIDSKINGSFDNSRFVGTVANNFIGLTDLNFDTNSKIKEAEKEAETEIVKGNLAVFTGPFFDNMGNLRASDQQVLSEAELSTMDYVLQNVRILE